MAVANIIAGLLGMFIGGALVDYYGKIRMMSIYLILLIILIVALVLLKVYWNNYLLVPAFIISFYILYTFLLIAIFATAMELCWKRISATQFTLYMAISNLGRATGAGFLGEIKAYFISWEYVILVHTIAAVFMLTLLAGMNTKKHLLSLGILEQRMSNS